MMGKEEILKKFEFSIIKNNGIAGYGISYDNNKSPFIFVNVKSKDFKKLAKHIPQSFEDLFVQVRIVERSKFL